MDDPTPSPRSVCLAPARSALASPFVIAARELRELGSRPLPLVGGALGSVLGCAALAAALLWMPSPAAAEPEEVFTVEFIPTSLTAVGESEAEAPADAPAPAPDPADASQTLDEAGASVSDAASEPASEPETKPETRPRPKTPPRPETQPPLPPKPDPGPAPGEDEVLDPFDDPAAWSTLAREGDPWATAILRALQRMKVPAWAGQISADSPYRFRLKICKDGRVDKVLRKGSTGDADLDATLAHELTRLDLPAVPAEIARTMGQRCAVLEYNFEWTASGVA